MDDLLDIAGDETRTGKTSQSDLAKDKPTLAVIHLLGTIDSLRRADVCAMLDAPGQSRRDLMDLLEQHGSLQYARRRAADYVVQATRELESVPASPAREALIETARFMANRTA